MTKQLNECFIDMVFLVILHTVHWKNGHFTFLLSHPMNEMGIGVKTADEIYGFRALHLKKAAVLFDRWFIFLQ